MAADPNADRPAAPSALAPLARPVFRALWIAALVSNIGFWMQSVGAVWQIGDVSGSPALVALVQTAISLPIVLLALPAGAAADVLDRRRLLLATQSWMLVSAAALCLATVAGMASPVVVLALTFMLGLGNAANAPAWQATIPELVGGRELPAAVALNSAGFNIGRSVGPAIGGLVVAAAGPAAVFGLNAVSYLGVLAVLWRWRRRPQDKLGAGEQVLEAIEAGARYVRFAPLLRAVLVRTALFILPASALWALLPVVARGRLGLDATGFGLLLGALGIGSVAGAVALPRLRQAVPIDWRVVAATVVFALATVALAISASPVLVWLAMVGAGMAWLAILTSLNVAVQTAVPRWVRARALAVYLLVFQGGLAAGSAMWGVVANRLGERAALLAAAVGFGLGLLAALRWRLQGIGALDLTPSVRPEPVTVVDPAPDDGPVLVLIRYRIDPARAEEFATTMRELRRVRRRDGAYRWGVFEDVADPGCFVETFVVRSWAEHLRQHERFTAEDLAVRDRVQSFHIGHDPPAVSHFIHPDAAIPQRRWIRWTRRHGEPVQADDD
ncbi:MAG TPA: MFS transporter [Actinomycetota bacterium]|nr:MFS transporter [Actinomycetota bacterium]